MVTLKVRSKETRQHNVSWIAKASQVDCVHISKGRQRVDFPIEIKVTMRRKCWRSFSNKKGF